LTSGAHALADDAPEAAAYVPAAHCVHADAPVDDE
jgi:hypothetical protein